MSDERKDANILLAGLAVNATIARFDLGPLERIRLFAHLIKSELAGIEMFYEVKEKPEAEQREAADKAVDDLFSALIDTLRESEGE